MNTFLSYTIPGIADGSLYALCALGLVLTYKTSGVFNFAHGALAATAAYSFYSMHIKHGMPWPLAFLLSLLLIGVVGGLVLERLAYALSSAPTVSIVVATVGVLVMLQSLDTAIYGQANIQLKPYLPQGGFHVGSYKVTGGDMIVTALSLGSAAVLFYFFGRTRTGKAMTGVVDDPKLLSLMGTNPATVRRLAWVLGSLFAATSGMLLAPKLGVSVNTLILLVIAAYGAAAIGLFDNLALVVAGGFAMGLLVDGLPYFTQKSSNVLINILPNNLPFVVLFATLLIVPNRKFVQRGVRNARRFRPVRTFGQPATGVLLSLAVVGLAVLPAIINTARLPQYASGLGFVIIFASLALITWTSGQISLCQIAFAAVGATTTGHMLGHGVPWPLAILIGGLITVPAGAVVAIPAIRLSGIYVAVATFGFGVLLQQIVYPSWLMFGVLNRVVVPRPHLLGIDFTSDRGYYFLALIVTVLAAGLILLVRNSRLGLLLRALSDSPDALDAHGTNTNVTKVFVFCIASFLAGIGGAVLAGVPQSASGSAGGTFDFTNSLVIVAVLGFCGRRPLFSPFLAATLFQVIKIYSPFNDPSFIKYEGVVFGLLAIAVAVAPGLGLTVRSSTEGKGRLAAREEDEVLPARSTQPAARPATAASLVPPLAASTAVGGRHQERLLETAGRA